LIKIGFKSFYEINDYNIIKKWLKTNLPGEAAILIEEADNQVYLNGYNIEYPEALKEIKYLIVSSFFEHVINSILKDMSGYLGQSKYILPWDIQNDLSNYYSKLFKITDVDTLPVTFIINAVSNTLNVSLDFVLAVLIFSYNKNIDFQITMFNEDFDIKMKRMEISNSLTPDLETINRMLFNPNKLESGQRYSITIGQNNYRFLNLDFIDGFKTASSWSNTEPNYFNFQSHTYDGILIAMPMTF